MNLLLTLKQNATTRRYSPAMILSAPGRRKLVQLQGHATTQEQARAMFLSPANALIVVREALGFSGKSVEVVDQPKAKVDYVPKAKPQVPSRVPEHIRDMYDQSSPRATLGYGQLPPGAFPADQRGGVVVKAKNGQAADTGGIQSVQVETSLSANANSDATKTVSGKEVSLAPPGAPRGNRVSHEAARKGMSVKQFLDFAAERGVKFTHANSAVTAEQAKRLGLTT